MAKLFAREAAMRHPTKAVQIQGGYGYIRGAKVERLMRGARIAEIYGAHRRLRDGATQDAFIPSFIQAVAGGGSPESY